MEHEGFVFEIDGGVGVLTMNRPDQLNAFTAPMWHDLPKIMAEIGNNKAVKVLILTGVGRGFCAGADLTALPVFKKMSQAALGDMMLKSVQGFINLPQPTIAAINGVTAGAGTALALLCDIRIGSEKARFASGYLRMALVPDLGTTWLLPKLVGSAKAMEFLEGGESFDSSEALRIGLLNRVVPEAQLLKASRALADRIAAGPASATALTRQAVRAASANTLEQQVALECSGFFKSLTTADHEEALKSFLEKRPPRFN